MRRRITAFLFRASLMLRILVAGVVGDLLFWGWYFWIRSALTGIAIIVGYLSIPSGRAYTRARGIKTD
jgi:hypothetical protein